MCPWFFAAEFQIHVTADVSYSIRQYLYSTLDQEFAQDYILPLEIARFWESRVRYNEDLDRYEIWGKRRR